MLPTSFDAKGCARAQQHSCCLVINDSIAIDAGNLAMAVTENERENIRDIILTHAHLDHIAGLPFFIDDLFTSLTEPVRVYAVKEVIEALDKHIFNNVIYPKFTEISNRQGKVLQYCEITPETDTEIKTLKFKVIEVNHGVASVGMIFSDGLTTIAFSGDTAETDLFWEAVNKEEKLYAVLLECAFPDELDELACASFHLTPKLLKKELLKFRHKDCPVYIVNIKPLYRDRVVKQILELKIPNLNIWSVGKTYNFD